MFEGFELAMIDTGDAGPLARLLGDAAPLFSQGEAREVAQWRGRLSIMRKTLERISLALRLTLPDQAMEESSGLAERIRDAAATARLRCNASAARKRSRSRSATDRRGATPPARSRS